MLHGDGSNTVAKKGGASLGYSGHKHQKGDKEITLVDNNGFVIAPLEVRAVNVTDIQILPDAIAEMVKFTNRVGINTQHSKLTLDSGFDSKTNKNLIQENQMKPVIYPNRRNTKKPIAIARLFRWFDRATYQLRYIVERTFAWSDVYRKLAVSYDRLEQIRLVVGFTKPYRVCSREFIRAEATKVATTTLVEFKK